MPRSSRSTTQEKSHAEGPTAVAAGGGAPFGAQVWELTLRTVTGLVRALEEDMKAEGFPLLWYDVLIQLVQAPRQRLRMQDLADAVILSRSGLTRLIDRMEEAGLVRRESAVDDRRGSYAVLTGEGRATYQRLAIGHREKIEERFSSRLGKTDLEALRRAMLKLGVVGEGSTAASEDAVGGDSA